MGYVKSMEEREGRGMAWVRHFVGEFGAAVLEGRAGWMCRREVARLWEQRAMVCGAGQKAAYGVETGVGHKRRKEQQQGGRENQKRGGRSLRKWGAAARFQNATGTHLDAAEHEHKRI